MVTKKKSVPVMFEPHCSTESKLLAVCVLLGGGSLISVLVIFMHGDWWVIGGQVQRHGPLAVGVF